MKLILFTFCISIFTIVAKAQTDVQTERLVLYGQVWGFLKYFHPHPSNVDWDQRLMDDYKSMQLATSEDDFRKVLNELIATCSDYTPKKHNIPDSLSFSESFEWMQNPLLSEEKKNFLKELKNNKPDFNNKYISGTPVGRPKVTNERKYEEFVSDPAINYLAISRYWNVINYYYPYRDLIPENWTEVYSSHLNEFLSAEDYESYYFAVRRLTAELRDGHGFIWTENNPMNTYRFAPYYSERVSDGLYVVNVWKDSIYDLDLHKMDKIISIDGKPTDTFFEELGEYISTSNDYYLSMSTYYTRISPLDSMTITVERDGELITHSFATIDRETVLSRYNFAKSKPEDDGSPYGFFSDTLSGKKYAYIDMGKLKRSDITGKFKRAIRKVDHVIIDVRNYPNWTVIKLSELLIKGKRKFARFAKMDFDYPGSFKWTESQTIGNRFRGYNGNLYVLVDYNTMSQAEYTVMALQQHPNAVVIGGQTAGADGNIAEIPLPFGIRSVFSGLGVFYPDGSGTQQVGVHRNYEVVQDKSYIDEGHDKIMEKALELIRE